MHITLLSLHVYPKCTLTSTSLTVYFYLQRPSSFDPMECLIFSFRDRILSTFKNVHIEENGRKRTIRECKSGRSLEGWKWTIRDESRRSLSQSRRSGVNVDDLWSKADDLLSRIRRSLGQNRRSKAKADDLEGWKQTTRWIKADDLIWNPNVWISHCKRTDAKIFNV